MSINININIIYIHIIYMYIYIYILYHTLHIDAASLKCQSNYDGKCLADNGHFDLVGKLFSTDNTPNLFEPC